MKLAHRAVPTLAFARFYLCMSHSPRCSRRRPGAKGDPALERALSFCAANTASRPRSMSSTRFHCVPSVTTRTFNDCTNCTRASPYRGRGFALGAVCAGCVIKNHCVGPCEGYTAAHGDRDLRPFDRRPRRIFEQRTTPAARMARRAARGGVARGEPRLRPTVNCNQDCTVLQRQRDHRERLAPIPERCIRRIARAGRRGVQRLSFSGGEPTLSKELVHYVRTASRLGIADIELVTNGVLIDSPAKVRPLREAGLTHAFVSLHAHDELLARRTTRRSATSSARCARCTRCSTRACASGSITSSRRTTIPTSPASSSS